MGFIYSVWFLQNLPLNQHAMDIQILINVGNLLSTCPFPIVNLEKNIFLELYFFRGSPGHCHVRAGRGDQYAGQGWHIQQVWCGQALPTHTISQGIKQC